MDFQFRHIFLAESSANVCSFESKQRGAPLEIRQNCWQPANIDIIKLPKITRTTTALFFMFSLCVTMFRRKDNKKEPVLKYN